MSITEITKQLPTGSEKIISDKTGISYPTVRKVFLGLKVKSNSELKIINAMTELLKEYKETKRKALQELQAVASI